ncbi:heterogeneous nuclear ribonucleoprotein L-like [Daktulosphaira vitifoliae]|uniref:heterogeneous nuclear ribonucleoprotein L-like n=1 Tax=Daktulosphaira vitifoliae TaxID=58002 RepID=UPI0021A9E3E5|nr:heterogeneous nuclear ribonucleoprotein L-like [Daktulosphaira vitifoliae]
MNYFCNENFKVKSRSFEQSNETFHHYLSTSFNKNLNKILVVYGFEHLTINCDMIFNLFCLYGNVMKVKILKNKMVLVEMNTLEEANRCIDNLHKTPIGHTKKIEVKYSKHYSIYNENMANKLSDGTYAYKIYSTSKLNRFSKVSQNNKRRPTAPSKILHFFNAPTDITGLDVHKTISKHLENINSIVSITILPKSHKVKCSTGLIEFKDISNAVKAVLKSNHLLIKSSKSKYPFLMKLCFSNYYDIHQTYLAYNRTRILKCRSMRFTPWLLHNSEQSIATTIFLISCIKVVNDNIPWTLRMVQETDYKQKIINEEETPNDWNGVLDLLKNKIVDSNNVHDNVDDKGDNFDHTEHIDVNKIGPLGDE